MILYLFTVIQLDTDSEYFIESIIKVLIKLLLLNKQLKTIT